MAAERQISRDDVTSTVGARRELGEDMEPEVIDAFLERVERAIDTRVDARLGGAKPAGRPRPDDRSTLVLGIVSMGTGIPITAIAGEAGGLLGILVAWLGIVGLNFAHARRPS